ncbi:Probable RNA-directed DNA polymerase from transposon X-element [Eumeta japonica]|uniref:Probable RNA-directed DNA polymerase from transposon X-element n=1 Tax=Eumeta variegata TaxID=151549 RepID=A0A4C1XS96_EUMVA|nr:Probable RNA-directed DNA polymerase from transposon X-element [Eumeta japonica]
MANVAPGPAAAGAQSPRCRSRWESRPPAAQNSTKNNSSDESDPTMEVELNHVIVHRDSPASPDKSVTKRRSLPRSNRSSVSIPTGNLIVKINFPSFPNKPSNRGGNDHTGERRRAISPPPPSDINKWKNPLPWVKPKATPEPNVRESPTHPPRRTGAAASPWGGHKYYSRRCRPRSRKSTPMLNNIPNDIVSTDDIDNAIGALTNHIRTVVDDSSRTVPANSDRKELPRDVKELIRQKRRLAPSEQIPHMKLDNSIAFDDREKAECLADSIEQQCSENPRLTLNMLGGWRFVAESPSRKTIWIPSPMMSNRHFTFRLDNTYSSVRPIRAGVPQGSTLSSAVLRSGFFAHARPDILYDLQVVQNKFCRRAADAPWYVKNSTLHRDFELPTISKFMKDASERFFDIASNHPNPLLVEAVTYEPPPPNHFCRRPRNILTDPPDDLTVEVEKLIELNKMVTD